MDEEPGAAEEVDDRCSISECCCVADEVVSPLVPPLPLPLLMTKGMRLETRR